MPSFLGELKRRSVLKVALTYTVAAWVLVQVVVTVEEPLGLPGWFDTFAIVALAIGFPIALILAWAFNITREVPSGARSHAAPDALAANGATGEAPPKSERENALEEPEILRHSVAVLPLENLSPKPEDAYFAAGIHEEILNFLSRIKDISVIARTSVKKYADTTLSIREIAKELRVATIMEGSVRYAGDRVRVTVQLIDAATEGHLWSEVYERKLTDVFAIQADIATQVTRALQATLSPAERRGAETRPTASADAYALYLKAMARFGEGDGATAPSTPPSVRAGIQAILDAAIDADPEFALPYGVKSLLYAILPLYDPITEQDWSDRCNDCNELLSRNANKALALDPSLSFPHLALAMNHQFNWRGRDAEEAYVRAFERKPNDSMLLTWYSTLKYLTEDFDDAIRLGERAVTVDPANSLAYTFLGMTFHSAGYFRKSIDVQQNASAAHPESALPHLHRALPEYALGHEAQALAALRLADRLLPDQAAPALHVHIAYGLSRLGQRQDTERLLAKLRSMLGERYVDPIVWVWADLAVGENVRAAESLRKALTKPELRQEPFVRNFIRENAWRDPALDEPEFVELREQLRFVE